MLAISMASSSAPHLLIRPDLDNSPSICSRQTPQPLDVMTTSQKPKLSLQTSGLTPSFNASISSRNTVNTDATTTPTTMNTFVNTFDLAYRPSPVSTISSPATQTQRRTTGHPSSATTRPSDQPYSFTLPFGLRAILKNSPLANDFHRSSACSASPTSRMPGRRIFFPPSKKVTFRVILEEEIVTKDYVRCHADLSSSEDDTGFSDVEQENIISTEDAGNELEERVVRVDECSIRGRKKRKSATSPDAAAGDGSRGRVEKPRSMSARRTKRKRRRWEWSADSGPLWNGTEARQEAGSAVGLEAVLASQSRPPDELPETSEQPDRADSVEDSGGLQSTALLGRA